MCVLTVNVTCEMPSRFRCANGYCIYSGLLCNQKDECGDGSDEKEELCKISHTYATICLLNAGYTVWWKQISVPVLFGRMKAFLKNCSKDCVN